MKYVIEIPQANAEMEAWAISEKLDVVGFKVRFRPRHTLAKIEFETSHLPNVVSLAAKAVNPAAKVRAI